MIKEVNDEEILLINEFLKLFNQKEIKSVTDNPFNKFVLYYVDDKAVAFMQYSLIYDRIELDYIYILDSYRKMGIASILMDYLIAILSRDNITNISLEVAEDNLSAIMLYEKYGFEKVAIRNNYYGDLDGFLYVKEVK